MNKTTACSLDCYDACEVEYCNGVLKGVKDGFTQGFLCPFLNHYFDFKVIQTPTYMGKEISLDEALFKLKEILKNTKKEKILHYRGHGNFALMQEVSDHFFASFKATLTDGNLCDGAGEAGILEGRGINSNMSISEIAKSDVVLLWGRNPHVTSSHLLTILKNKTIIVIDPIKIKIAKTADLHIQIKPHSDIYLALLLSRFLYLEGSYDEEFVKEYASEFEDYYELTQTLRIKETLQSIDVSLGQIGKVLELIKGKKVAIVCGIGVQKYRDGADVMRCIDAFAVFLGLFNKEGCGVAYLGNSREQVSSPFNSTTKKISKVDTDFSKFDTIFMQGTNPLSQMPNTSRVKESLSYVSNKIYFGLYENESSNIADLVIPSKSFLAKDDIRTSYSHTKISIMHKVLESDYGISEYDLTAYLCQEFGINIESEEFYLNHFKSSINKDKKIKKFDGFSTDDGEFLFLEEYEALKKKEDGLFYLITPKSPKSLNSQFNRESCVYLHSSLGFKDGESIYIESSSGSIVLKVKYNNNLRDDCVLIYSGTKGVNNLTTSKHSFSGKNAVYQENKVSLIKKK